MNDRDDRNDLEQADDSSAKRHRVLGGTVTTLHVDPAYLGVVTGRLRTTRADLERVRTSHPAIDELGPTIVAAVEEFRDGWGQGLRLVDEALDQLGRILSDAACRYAATDGAVERAYRA